MATNNNQPLRVVPTIGSSTRSPGAGYPDAPSYDVPVSHDPEQGIPRDVNTFAMGISIMGQCTACGTAVPEAELGAHYQSHGTNYGPTADDFGAREFQI